MVLLAIALLFILDNGMVVYLLWLFVSRFWSVTFSNPS
jgi:hypothetical protein